jgi:hypothetical protein
MIKFNLYTQYVSDFVRDIIVSVDYTPTTFTYGTVTLRHWPEGDNGPMTADELEEIGLGEPEEQIVNLIDQYRYVVTAREGEDIWFLTDDRTWTRWGHKAATYGSLHMAHQDAIEMSKLDWNSSFQTFNVEEIVIKSSLAAPKVVINNHPKDEREFA